MYGDKEGPTEVVIPEQRFLSCGGCKYYKHDLLKSGRDPIYANNCTHPSAPSRHYHGNLQEGFLNREITPGEWCPFIKENIDPNILTEDEIDYELGIHDCGQNPYCGRYRSCDNDHRPIPSQEKIDQLIIIGTERFLKEGYDLEFINEYFKEKWSK